MLLVDFFVADLVKERKKTMTTTKMMMTLGKETLIWKSNSSVSQLSIIWQNMLKPFIINMINLVKHLTYMYMTISENFGVVISNEHSILAPREVNNT